MEKADTSLHARLAEPEPVPAATVLDWIRQILAGLAAMHKGDLVHRDISPTNLMFAGDRLKIADVGTVRSTTDADITSPGDGAQLGSLIYIADEQRRDPHSASRAADVFSSGQIAYQMLTGLVPIANPPRLDRFPDVSPAVASVVETMREYQAEARHPDAGAALAAFRDAQACP
jgi:serine/threonine protein kinase